MDSEVKKALDELLKLELNAEAQQLIVNLVSALAKSGCNITPTRDCLNLSILSGSPTSPTNERVEEPGIDLKTVPTSPSFQTPVRNRIKPENSRRKLLSSPDTDDKEWATESSRQICTELDYECEARPIEEESGLKAAWESLSVVLNEAKQAFNEYRTKMIKALQEYENYCANFTSRNAFLSTCEWKDFLTEQRYLMTDLEKYKIKKLRRRAEGSQEQQVVLDQVENAFREARALRMEEIQMMREKERNRRQARIAQTARDMCYWSEEVNAARIKVEETVRKCEEIRRYIHVFSKKMTNGYWYNHANEILPVSEDVKIYDKE